MEWKSIVLEATGSRSFGASYTESDLECAIVSENFEDFADFCRYLNAQYSGNHDFSAFKTQAGLPLLVIKGKDGASFECPLLSADYPGKKLPQLEITFRHPNTHDVIQAAGLNFFAQLSDKELESYIFNKRYIELMQRNAPKDMMMDFDGQPVTIRAYLEKFKSAISAPLKCLPAGMLQDTPKFDKAVFTNLVIPQTTLSELMATGATLYQAATPSNSTAQSQARPSL